MIDGSTQACPSTRCIELDGSLATGTVDGLQINNSSGNLITGMIVNRFTDDGISIEGASSTNNTIVNNSIGTNAAGNAIWGSKTIPSFARQVDPIKGGKEGDDRLAGAFGNAWGVYIPDASGNTVRGNTISGNSVRGVLTATASSNNLFEGNMIGTDQSGTIALGNTDGIRDLGTGSTFIFNTIAFNTSDGFRIEGSQASISQNSVYENGGEGIDLGNDGPTPNDAGDADTGANNLQNFPEIDAVGFPVSLTDAIFVDYRVTSTMTASAYPLTVEFFIADVDGEEGQIYLGSHEYTTPDVIVSAQFNPVIDVTPGASILATATDANGNSSEFSPAVTFEIGPFVYWIDKSSKTINKGNIDGLGAPQIVFDASDGVGAGGIVGQHGLYVDEFNGKIYWTEGSRIVRANIDGSGLLEVLYDAADGLPGLRDLEIDIALGMVYWMGIDVIQRAPIDGSGPVETLFSSPDPLSLSFNLVLDRPSGKIYWAQFDFSLGSTTGIFRGDIDGGNVERVAEILAVSHIALDHAGGMIYWTSREAGDAGIKRMPLDGSGAVETIYSASAPEFLVLDRGKQQLYWTDSGSDEILRGSMDGSATAEVLFDGQAQPEGIDLGLQDVQDITLHMRKPGSWGIPRFSQATQGELIPEPGVAMEAEGCGWFKYTLRAVNFSIGMRLHGTGTSFRTRDFALLSETWINAIDPGDGTDWEVGGPTSPPSDYTNCSENVDLAVKVALAGPYDEGTDMMKQGLLEKDLIPSGQGYDDPLFFGSPQYYGGSESWLQLGAGESDAVDWVIVELRTDPNDPASSVASKAGILRTSGLITDPELGATSLSMPVASGFYHIVVRHRNHLPIMSASLVGTPATSTTSYDFTTSMSQAFGTNPMIQVDSSPVKFAMIPGDGNLNGSVSALDFVQVWLPANGGSDAYEQADFDMNGTPSAFDFINGFLPGNGKSSQVPD